MNRVGPSQAPVRTESAPSGWPVVDLRMLVALYVLLAVIAGFLALQGPFDAGTRITRAALGPAWPLTISEATLHCEFRGEIVVQHRGTGYSLTRHDKHGAYTDIGAIHAEDTDGRKKDLGPLIERGKHLCH